MKTLFSHIVAIHILAYVMLRLTELAFTPGNFTLMFFAVYLPIWLFSYIYDREHFRKLPILLNFIGFFIWEMITANIKIAIDAVTPVIHMTPAIIKLPLEAKSDLEITLLANLLSLTPGTLSIDVSNDRKHLYVHTTYMDEGPRLLKAKIKLGFEKRLLKLTR